MLRLLFIRLLETYFRRPIIYLIPIGLAIIPAAFEFLDPKQNYLAVAGIQIRTNLLIQELGNVANVQARGAESRLRPADRTATEMNNLIRSNSFLVEVLDHIGIDNPEYRTSHGSRTELIEAVRRGSTAYANGYGRVAIVIFNENEALATALANGIFETYLERKISEGTSEGTVTNEQIDQLVEQRTLRVEAIEKELQDYLVSHPLPNAYFVNRPDIEEFQIAQLRQALEEADSQLEAALITSEKTDLFNNTTAEIVNQTYILIDVPTSAVRLTSTTQLIVGVIQNAILGAVASAAWIYLMMITDRRIMLPLDVEVGVGQPVLTMVAYDFAGRPRNLIDRIWRLTFGRMLSNRTKRSRIKQRREQEAPLLQK